MEDCNILVIVGLMGRFVNCLKGASIYFRKVYFTPLLHEVVNRTFHFNVNISVREMNVSQIITRCIEIVKKKTGVQHNFKLSEVMVLGIYPQVICIQEQLNAVTNLNIACQCVSVGRRLTMYPLIIFPKRSGVLHLVSRH